jgi:hypothetical protein
LLYRFWQGKTLGSERAPGVRRRAPEGAQGRCFSFGEKRFTVDFAPLQAVADYLAWRRL